jgi:hypothetical protein
MMLTGYWVVVHVERLLGIAVFSTLTSPHRLECGGVLRVQFVGCGGVEDGRDPSNRGCPGDAPQPSPAQSRIVIGNTIASRDATQIERFIRMYIEAVLMKMRENSEWSLWYQKL